MSARNFKNGTYYLGRVVKGGLLDQEKLIDAIRNAETISSGRFKWTIGEVIEGSVGDYPYIYGELMKYRDRGEVAVVDEVNKVEEAMIAPGLLEAKSPFVYFKDFSGIAYLHVWNQIDETRFRRQFERIVLQKSLGFFTTCEIEAISDLGSFHRKVLELKEINQLKARVKPPNPMFGDCWKRLNQWIKERNDSVLQINEESKGRVGGIASQLQRVLASLINKASMDDVPELFLADAAILMAVDGYGKGSITGVSSTKNAEITIHTSQSQKSLVFAKDPNDELLAKKVLAAFVEIAKERNMKHG